MFIGFVFIFVSFVLMSFDDCEADDEATPLDFAALLFFGVGALLLVAGFFTWL